MSRLDIYIRDRRRDALDPRYIKWQEALKKAYQAKNAAEKAEREGAANRHSLREKADRLETEQQRLAAEGWENTSTNIIGGRR